MCFAESAKQINTRFQHSWEIYNIFNQKSAKIGQFSGEIGQFSELKKVVSVFCYDRYTSAVIGYVKELQSKWSKV